MLKRGIEKMVFTVMKGCFILLLFSFLDSADSSCSRGGYNNYQPQFGPGCMYRCHCVDDGQCDFITGNCPKGCAAGWMGLGCQYGDIAYSKKVLSGWNFLSDGSLATDGLPTTCAGPATLVLIDLTANYRISGLVINWSDAGYTANLTGYEVRVGNSSSDPSSDIVNTCFKQTITHQLDTSTDVVCTTEIVGRYLLIRTPDNETTMTLCDVRVYGGRSLAYGRNGSQSSTTSNRDVGIPVASLALDGNTDTRFKSYSCTHTNVEMSSWWRVNLAVVYTIERIVLYGRSDSCCTERLSGFSVSFATNSSFNLVFSYPMNTPPLISEVITLSENYAQHVEISLMNINQSLILCEVFVFGDCQDNMCGWTCDIVCHCEGPIAKQNIIDATCASGCKTGWWGRSCNNTCDSNCKGKTCNQTDGHCLECSLGKWGHFCNNNCTNCLNNTGCGVSDGICSVGCIAGIFDISCGQQCGQCADDGSCNRYTGACIHGCHPGWQEDNCTIVCPSGWYGINCSNKCGYCADRDCHHINGSCPFGCSDGYNGTKCSEPCSLGWYGKNCSNICGNCTNKTCDNINGTCPFGCSEGYNGTSCNESCPLGWYGINCSIICGHCAKTTCANINGTCPLGCFEGYNGTRCNEPCKSGWYGINCRNICGHCANTTCDHINGTCPFGCSAGYNGTSCYEGLSKEIISTEASTSVLIGALIGGVLGAAGLIFIIALTIIAAKRRNSALRGHRYQSKEPDEHPSMQPTYENIYSNSGTERQSDLPVKRTEESCANNYANINRNETEDIEMIIEGEPDRTIESKAENVHDNTYYNIGKCSQGSGRRIAIHDLSDYMKSGSHLLNDIEEEFKKLLSGPQHEMNIALNPENRQKNRYKGMYAYDNNRVILETLPDDPDTDYINASFINGYKRDNAYIAAQGTIAATVTDFWRMIWQYDVEKIVMLTGLTEQGKHKCLQYWPNDGSSEYGMIRVEIIDEDICTEYVIRSFIISKTGSKKQKTVNQFHFTSWPDRGVPETSSSLVQFWKKVRHSGNSRDAPILVHCSAGIGRTGTYIALDYSFDEGNEEGYVNIFECINKLRGQRIGLVQTAEQYVFLHAVLLEAFTDMVGHVSADDFQNYYTQMQGIDSGMKRIKLLAEFEKSQEDEYIYVGKRNKKDRNSEPKDEFMDGKLSENKLKNRFNNILPSERYRPYLSTYVRDHNDYINAVCLPTRKNRKGLLVTQMPLPDTVIDFWRLVYDYEVQSIVMLNEANMPGEAIGVYWPENDDASRYGPFIVKIASHVEKASHIERMLEVSKQGEEQTLSLKQFVCSIWGSNDSVPKSIDGFLNLIDDVEDWKRKSGERPILVHCMNGAERSGLFCVLWCVLEKLKSDREVAIRSVVRQLRIRRQQIIPNFEQYKFCHDVVCFNLSKSTTYTNM